MSSRGVRRVPALIVGGGPVGLYASALLSSYGTPSILAERSLRGPSQRHPRAHLINSRSMELLRELGVEGAVRDQTPPLAEWRHFRYCTTLLGTQIAAQDHTAGSEWAALQAASASEMAHLSQPKLEAILLADATRRAPEAGGLLLDGYECVAFEPCDGSVRATLRRVVDATDPRGGSGGGGGGEAIAADEVIVEADHLLACDGAHSSVRRALGLRLRGPPPLQHFKSVYFTAPELAPRLRTAGAEAMLYFTFNRGAIAVLVAHNIERGEWVAQLPYFPGLQESHSLDKAACTAAIAACIGDAAGAPSGTAAVPFEVRSIGSWAMSAKVAQRLSLGRVHLLGDAAHQFPPAGAFGANTGLQDAHNLCWKIGAMHRGLAGQSLVATYDGERRSVALANARLAVHNYHRGLRVTEALGLPSGVPHALADLLTRARSAVGPPPLMPPASVRAVASAFGDALLGFGRTQLIERLGHEAPHAVGRWRLDRARSVVASGRALPLLFARHELGYVYPPTACAAEGGEGSGGDGAEGGRGDGRGDARRQPGVAGASTRCRGDGGRDGESDASIEDETYVPSTRVGARLPHHWLEAPCGARLSSHDLLHDLPTSLWEPCRQEARTPTHGLAAASHAADGAAEDGATRATYSPALPNGSAPRLTLLIDPSAGQHWLAGAASLSAPAAPMRVMAIDGSGAASAAAELAHPFADCRTVRDPSGGWGAKRQVAPCGALLVRPDGHVAWRCESFPSEGTPAMAQAMLRRALAVALALPIEEYA